MSVEIQFLPGSEPWVRIRHASTIHMRRGTMPIFEVVLWLLGWEQGH